MRNLLQALESLFMIRTIPVSGDQKGTTYFFEDFLEFNSLRSENAPRISLKRKRTNSPSFTLFAPRSQCAPILNINFSNFSHGVGLGCH